jgi:hypothetical protein
MRGQEERSAPAEKSRQLSLLIAQGQFTIGPRALPVVVLDIKVRAGGDELLDHERVAAKCGQDERSEPAGKSVAGLSSVRPMQSAPQSPPRALPVVALDVEVGAGVD